MCIYDCLGVYVGDVLEVCTVHREKIQCTVNEQGGPNCLRLLIMRDTGCAASDVPENVTAAEHFVCVVETEAAAELLVALKTPSPPPSCSLL